MFLRFSRPAIALPGLLCLLLLYGAHAALASAAEPQPVAATTQQPHIALLLPLHSKIFGAYATAVRDGCRTAFAQTRALLPVREYAVATETGSVLEAYRTALAAGAQVVVGPLTRDAVTALASGEPVPVPTLALSTPDVSGRLPGNLYILGLQVETEARQVARLAWQAGHRNAITVSSSSLLQRRMQAAFAAEFARLGGALTADMPFSADAAGLETLSRAGATTDLFFLALDFSEARTARAYLGAVPVYATSSVHAVNPGTLAGFDLAGVTFVDMPWLLAPDHAAVMIYPRPPRTTADLERLHALGIDACRIVQLLLAGARDIRLDGVTGQLTLGVDGRFERELSVGRYRDGAPRLVEPAARESTR